MEAMMRTLTYPDTRAAESRNITGTDIGRLAEMPQTYRDWFFNAEGVPQSIPSLPTGNALVCQIDLPGGATETWLCNNVGTMRELHARYVAGEATAIRWYTGFVVGLEVPATE